LGLRETINQKPGLFGAVFGLVALGAIAYVLFGTGGPLGGGPPPAPAFYTTDSSSEEAALANLFTDRGDRIAPFDHEGKEAVRAVVFRNDDVERGVAHLTKFTPEFRQELDAMPESERAAAIARDAPSQTLVKRPGGEWANMMSQEGMQVMIPPAGRNYRTIMPED
jgi:hypothetical protein